MALTQQLSQLEAGVRAFADIGGTTALARHPQPYVYDCINRALGSLHRLLTEVQPDQRILSSSTITTAQGTTTYPLDADFDHLISVDLTANGYKTWLTSYDMPERPGLTSPQGGSLGVPLCYRLRGSDIELLPSPSGVYTVTLWYVPDATQLAAGTDTYDTISRLDDYIIAYAARFIAVRDKNGQLKSMCEDVMGELRADILAIARSRDKNSPARIVDDSQINRWGRRSRR